MRGPALVGIHIPERDGRIIRVSWCNLPLSEGRDRMNQRSVLEEPIVSRCAAPNRRTFQLSLKPEV